MSGTLLPARAKSKRERTREGLVTAAEQLFALRGPDAVSIDEITAAAEVAKGTFYTHFADKDDIERAIARSVREELETEVDRTNDGIEDAGIRMANGLATYLSFAVRQPVRARTLLRLMSGVADPESPVNSGIRADVVRGVNTKRFDVVSVNGAVLLGLGACVACIAHLVQSPKSRAAQTAAEVITTVLRGFGLKAAEAKKLAEAATTAAFAKGGKDK
ncbi:MAG: TetR family transcriptional regulator [Alphaproteobacteria bacterium]|nr:TetR family transcriptional regulator [Alphaproteobacteria bacterium]